MEFCLNNAIMAKRNKKVNMGEEKVFIEIFIN